MASRTAREDRLRRVASLLRRGRTQEQIAVHIGTVREMVGRTLRAFTAEGLIRRQRGQMMVLDREALAREAGVA